MRSGSIVPRGPVMDYTGQIPLSKIYLEIFPRVQNGKFLLYEDDGISLEHENGKFATTLFKYKIVNHSLIINIGERKSGYRNMPEEREYYLKVFKIEKPDSVIANGLGLKHTSSRQEVEEKEETWYYSDRENLLLVNLKKMPVMATEIKIEYKKY